MTQGDKVTYIGSTVEQVRWGSNDDPGAVLEIGKQYTVKDVEVHTWHTKIQLLEHPGMRFNSVSFEVTP